MTNKLEQTGFCLSCGIFLTGKAEFFCNEKCEKSYERKRRIKNGRWSGHSVHRNETGEFQGGIKK